MTQAKPQPLRILLIEDNPGDARLIREMLADAAARPFELYQADRLSAGLDLLATNRPDVILLDLSLPDCQGFETFRMARSRAPSTPIVVLSGLDDETLALHAVQEGAQDYLVKGHVDGDLLLRSMSYAIERQRVEAERAQALARERAARAEAEGLAAERAAILGQIADGVIIADPKGRVTFVNTAARRLLGLPEDADAALLHQPAMDGAKSPGVLPTEGLWPLEQAALQGQATVGVEIVIRQPGGAEVVTRGSATPVVGEDGTRLGAVLTLHDVTEERRLERQKDEFLANISHDLRTPLTAIKASIGVVLANEPVDTPEPLHRMFVNINVAAERMAKMVDDLLELHRLQSGRAQLRPDPCDLRALALRAARTIEPLAAARAQTVGVKMPPEPLRAMVDAERLERAVLNLLSNAHQYGREGGSIQLGLERRGDQILLWVADDGPGIAPGDQQRIFERFYRPDTEIAKRQQGSGLGLPIAQAMVEMHGGRLWVESVPGEGATFWISLPAALASSQDIREDVR